MSDQKTVKTIILGVGNLLLSDEGAGLRVVEQLAKTYHLPDNVQTLDGGTLGLDLLHYLEGEDGRPVDNLLIIDAVEMGEVPGSLLRMEGDEIPSAMSVKMPPHQIGIPDMLFAAKLRDLYPPNIVLLGIQPASLEVGLTLSPRVEARMEELVSKAVEELTRWGHRLKPRVAEDVQKELV
jgi:hydrogenase maturation protease